MSIRVVSHSARRCLGKAAAMRVHIGEIVPAKFRAVGKSRFTDRRRLTRNPISFDSSEWRRAFADDFLARRLRFDGFIAGNSAQAGSRRVTLSASTGRHGAALPCRVFP
ncbi:hypothetical protein [Burkholderia latens]|uniref:Uncharacterized protein n=1 Tax=Burkholderia latens TaxID=488446 RepID=A0A6H9TSI0_9BURK|nr:hypothetical protein [Burkholderia latens]KAB0643309.1 hypothetical protein F7R21_08200 [Burkholderia latens]